MRTMNRTPILRGYRLSIIPRTVWMLLLAGWGALLVFRAASATEEVRYHGFRLDGKHLLLLEQRHREIMIGIAVRSRSIGDTSRTRTRDGAGDTMGRFGEMEYLARITAEILEPSAPNYLRNPGQRYRFVIEGLGADPEFRTRIEIDAIAARAAVLAELNALGARTHGIQREALHYAGPYVLEVLNETNLMPAHIATSIAESRVGRIRFDNPGLQRESIEAGRKLYAGEKREPATSMSRDMDNTNATSAGEGAKQP